LAAGDPVEDLIRLLQDIERKLADEQAADDDFIRQFQSDCDETLSKLEYEITEAKTKAATLQAELDEKIPIRDEKVRQLKEKNEFKNMLVEKLVDLERRKELRDEEWAQTQEEHDKATYVIEKAKQIIASALNAAFLQKDSASSKIAFADVSEHFLKAAKQ
jgi:DNA repair exonuclease SbcCD ATPase subunit